MMSIVEAAKKVNKSVPTIRNWVKKGYRCPDGRVVVLKSTRFGRMIAISQEQIDEFVRELNGEPS